MSTDDPVLPAHEHAKRRELARALRVALEELRTLCGGDWARLMELDAEVSLLVQQLRLSLPDAPPAGSGFKHAGGTHIPYELSPGGRQVFGTFSWYDRLDHLIALAKAIESEPEPGAGEGKRRKRGRPDSEEWRFAPSDKGYSISGFGESGHLPGYKGLSDIARLIATPDVPVSMLELDGADQRLQNDRHSHQPAVDAEGKREIAERRRELKADLERAEQENNTVEADLARKQIEELDRSFTSAKGLGGKARDLNDLYNKLRPKIYGRLRDVYKAMRKATPPMDKLADHFESSIGSTDKTAYVYRPVGGSPPWQFQPVVKK
jgi:hypothetical protein